MYLDICGGWRLARYRGRGHLANAQYLNWRGSMPCIEEVVFLGRYEGSGQK